MRTRTSFELYSGGCRLVEVVLSAGRGRTSDARVKTFASRIQTTDDAAALTRAVAGLRQQRKLARSAWVTIWGLRSTQQFLRLPPAKPADLEALAAREARKDIAALETPGDPAALTIVAGAEVQVGSQKRREVSLVAVSSTEVRRRIQPLIDAGFVVEGVLTPALALTALARTQPDMLPGTVVAYVALTARATCLAIIRDGVLLFAREMPWGHDTDPTPAAEDALATRLVSELRRSVLYFKQTFRSPVEGVVLCGDMPNLRALTAPLGAALDVSVKPLDSLVGIDAATLPAPADQFRAEVAALRLAIAVGTDAVPVANLLPAAIRLTRAARAQMVRVAGALAASVLLVILGYSGVQRSAAGYELEKQDVERQLAQLEPQARLADEQRQAYTRATARRAAIVAFDSQGPRLARLLEVLSQATPEQILLTSVTVEADGLYWRATVTGVAVTDDAASGQVAVNGLIAKMSASPYVGALVQPPALRVVSGTGASNAGDQAAAIPEGMSGVEFVLKLQVAR